MTTRLALYSEFLNIVSFFLPTHILVEKLRIMLTTKRKCDKQKKKSWRGLKFGFLNFSADAIAFGSFKHYAMHGIRHFISSCISHFKRIFFI